MITPRLPASSRDGSPASPPAGSSAAASSWDQMLAITKVGSPRASFWVSMVSRHTTARTASTREVIAIVAGAEAASATVTPNTSKK